MGIFDFIKDAGEKLGGGGKSAPAPQAQTRPVDPAQLEALKRRKALEQLVAELGLQVEGLEIEVTGDTAVVRGKVDDQAEREKVILAVGNVRGIARVDDRLEAAKKAPEAKMHTVVAGDSLSKIAKHFYGNAGDYMKIFNANTDQLKNPDLIQVGQVLKIPVGDVS
jgi:nucleoid-associated protein YgaU